MGCSSNTKHVLKNHIEISLVEEPHHDGSRHKNCARDPGGRFVDSQPPPECHRTDSIGMKTRPSALRPTQCKICIFSFQIGSRGPRLGVAIWRKSSSPEEWSGARPDDRPTSDKIGRDSDLGFSYRLTSPSRCILTLRFHAAVRQRGDIPCFTRRSQQRMETPAALHSPQDCQQVTHH